MEIKKEGKDEKWKARGGEKKRGPSPFKLLAMRLVNRPNPLAVKTVKAAEFKSGTCGASFTLSDVSSVLRRRALTISSSERESILVRDRSRDLRRLLDDLRAAARGTQALPSSPLHDRSNDNSVLLRYNTHTHNANYSA